MQGTIGIIGILLFLLGIVLCDKENRGLLMFDVLSTIFILVGTLLLIIWLMTGGGMF